MPLWQIYHPPNAFTSDEKKYLSEGVTELYHGRFGMPKFYAVVIFTASDDIYVGGEQNSNFIRIVISHLARESNRDETAALESKTLIDKILKPVVADKGFDWEFSYSDSPRLFWRINGFDPPLNGSEEEKIWVKANKAVPIDGSS